MTAFRFLGIVGDPIAHSLSPAMHNAVLRRSGFRFFYLPFHVTPDRLKGFVRDVPLLPLAGFNVTIPHKEAVLKHLSWVSPEAKAIGAVNTVVVSGRRLKGYNTDAPGYLRSLVQEAGFRPRGKSVLVLGAGGSARAVIYALAAAGAKIILIANRTLPRARALAREFSKKFRRVAFSAIPLETKVLASRFPATDLLVNTTSVGLDGTAFPRLPLANLKKTAVVSDLVYKPPKTPLLKAAARRGLTIHTGDGMLLHQGALAYRLWTGRKPDLKVMKKALLDAMKRR
ncbi:MAG TPA: shikimate dehydrogenase [bacterium]|nr:shikimate dehydrogenase [bacterium]